MTLLAAGCSYSDKNYIKHLIVPTKTKQPSMWPELFGKNLNITVYNIAKSGNTNKEIFDSYYERNIKYKPKIVLIGLTEWSRIYIPGYGAYNPVFAHDIVNYVNGTNNNEFEKADNEKIKNIYDIIDDAGLLEFSQKIKLIMSSQHYIDTIVNNLFQNLFLILELCKSNNVKILIAQLVNPYPLWFTDKKTLNRIENAIIKSPYMDYLNVNKKYLIGWPFLPSLDGWNYDYKREIYDKDKLTWTHADDRHPNQLGQQQIADIYYENYINVYKT